MHVPKSTIAIATIFVLALCQAGSASPADPWPLRMVYLFDVVKNPAYRDSWRGLLRSAGPLPAWIATFDGPSSPMPSIPFDDNIYQLGQECKAHDCADNQIYVLFAPRGVRAWGLLIEAGRQIRWLGHPDEPIRRKLAAAAELYSGH